MSNDIRGERLQVMLSPEELSALDDFRFKHRMPTRAAAVRELLKLGLTVVVADATAGMKSASSRGCRPGPGADTAAMASRKLASAARDPIPPRASHWSRHFAIAGIKDH